MCDLCCDGIILTVTNREFELPTGIEPATCRVQKIILVAICMVAIQSQTRVRSVSTLFQSRDYKVRDNRSRDWDRIFGPT